MDNDLPEDEPELEVVLEEEPAVEPEKPDEGGDDDELASYSKNVQKRIKKLTYEAREAQRERDRLAREQEELAEFTRRTRSENLALKKALQSGQTVLAEQIKSRVSTDLTLAEEKLKKAMELGDADGQIAAQKEIARLTVEADKVSSFRPAPVEEEAPVVREPPRPRPSDKALDWHKKNSWFGRDNEMTAYARHLDERIRVFDKVDPSSDEYWKTLDKEMGKRFPHLASDSDDEDDDEVTVDVEKPKRSVAVAPVKRNNTPPRKITLNPTERAIADRLKVSYKDYAREKIKGMTNG